MGHKMFPASEASKFDAPERLTWLPPAEVLSRLNLRPGMTVADIGAGTGYFTIPIAAEIKPSGSVLAVDAQPEMLEKLRAKLESAAAPGNIRLVHGTAEKTGLPDASCDLVLMANLWHELDNRAAALAEARRILRDADSRLAILDWRDDVESPPGPPREHRIALKDALCELEMNSWTLYDDGGIGMYHYLLVAGITDESVQS